MVQIDTISRNKILPSRCSSAIAMLMALVSFAVLEAGYAQNQPFSYSVSSRIRIFGVETSSKDIVTSDLSPMPSDLSAALPANANLDALCIRGNDIYFSLDSDERLSGTLYADEDVIRWNGTGFEMAWDGSANGLPARVDLDALIVISTEPLEIEFSLDCDARLTIGGVPTLVADEDTVRFRAGDGFVSIGLRGSDAGFPPSSNLDAIGRIRDGLDVVSFGSAVRIESRRFRSADLLLVSSGAFIATLPFFDATSEGLPCAADIDALDLALFTAATEKRTWELYP